MTASRNRHPRRLAFPLVAALLLSGIAPAQKAAAVNEGYLDVTVQDGNGDPLPGASVQLYPANVPLPDPVNDPSWHPGVLQSAASGVDGVAHFVLDFADPTLQVNVYAEGVGYSGKWYQAASEYANANDLSIAPGETTTAALALFQQLRHVQVYTYDAVSMADLAGSTVGLYSTTGDGTTPDVTGLTDSTGTLKLHLTVGQLPAGSYRVLATRAGYAPQWDVDPGQPNDFAHALELDLTAPTGSQSADIGMTASAPLAFTTAPTPTISGKRIKGKTLTARPGTWAPQPSRFTYQWYRGTKAISGATARTYTLRKADVGKRIKVRVKAYLAGYITTARTSALTTVIRP